MTKQADRVHIIDQLEQLKQGLDSILSKETNSDPFRTEVSRFTKETEEAVTNEYRDKSLLENFSIINATRSMVENRDHSVDRQDIQAILVVTQNYEIVAFNRSAISGVFTSNQDEIQIGTSIISLFPEVHHSELMEWLNQGFTGVSVHLTTRLSFDQQPEQWYEINLFPIQSSDSQINRMVCCIENIKERKEAQANLRALQINFQSVFKQAAVSVVLSNINLQVIQANRKFYELIEYSPAEFKALPPLSITHPRDMAESKRLLSLLCQGELDSFSLEKRLIAKSGKVIWVYLTTNIIRDPKGKPKLIISVAQDVTDRKHAEQELIFKSNELDTFIYRASHDLRGPVASLMGLFNVVQTEFKQDSHAMEYFEHYHKSVLRLNKILHNLIDLTKIKEVELAESEVDLNDMISESLASVSSIQNFEDIHFKIKNEVDFKLRSDANSIRTILFHLLENAVTFIQADNDKPFVKLELRHESNFLIIEVTDNGQGIKKELQSEVFNMFYRANERSSGSGLGLYIVRYAVEKLNGSIQLKSKEMSGTKISVYIPYTEPNSITASSSISTPNSDTYSNKRSSNRAS
jgi:PAS domain S-box-containing protein